jgi:predicted extracellular nuclease
MNTLRIKPVKPKLEDGWAINRVVHCLLVYVLLVWALFGCVVAQTKTAEPNPDTNQLTVCSQNLENLGSIELMRGRNLLVTHKSRDKKIAGIVERMAKLDCDVIAMQELLGSQIDGTATAEELAERLTKRTKRKYAVSVGVSNDPSSGVGYLYATDTLRLVDAHAYRDVSLPKLTFYQRLRRFIRAPYEIGFEILSEYHDIKFIRLINFHFKSKSARSSQDMLGLHFEDWRMESAEALREIARDVVKSSEVVVLLGDRNSGHDSASARILEGQLALSDFQKPTSDPVRCKIGSDGVPLCLLGTGQASRFKSVLTDGMSKGSYVYKGRVSWLDDILIPVEQLKYVGKDGYSRSYLSGVLSEPVASDHAMVYVKLEM